MWLLPRPPALLALPARPFALLTAFVALACAGDDTTSVAPVALQPAPAAEPEPASPVEPEPVSSLYLVHSAVEGDEGRVNYLTTVPSLVEARALDYSDSLELPGRARVYASPDPGSIVVGDAESVTLERRTLDPSGRLAPGERLSLQALGVASLGAQALTFVSADKAYYNDSGQGQVIVIDWRQMLIERVLPLPSELLRDGLVMNVSDWAVREGEAFFAVGWTTDTYDRVEPGSVLVRIDTATNELTVSEEPRCRELSTAAELDGTLYFFSGVINAFGHAVYPGDGGQQDCFLRVLPGERSFDPSFVGTLSGALPDRTGATAVGLTPDGLVWAQVADLNVAPTTPGATYSEWYQDGWSWWSVPLSGGEARRIDQPSGAYSASAVSFDGAFLISQAAADYSQTTLVDLSGSTPRSGLSFPGFTLDVLRLR